MFKRTILGFIAGAVSFLVFFTAVWALIQMAGYIPANANPPWSMGGVPPYDVPRVASYAFWSGLWGAVLANVLARAQGAVYWISWVVIGAIALSLVVLFVLPPLRGQPMAALTPQRLGVLGLLHGAWGLGAAIVLKLIGGARAAT